MNPTVRVLADGNLAVGIPSGSTGNLARRALVEVLPADSWSALGRRSRGGSGGDMRVHVDFMTEVVAVLEHYYDYLIVLEPESTQVASEPGSETATSILEGLTPEQAKAVYRALGQVLHPDKPTGTNEAFQRLRQWAEKHGL